MKDGREQENGKRRRGIDNCRAPRLPIPIRIPVLPILPPFCPSMNLKVEDVVATQFGVAGDQLLDPRSLLIGQHAPSHWALASSSSSANCGFEIIAGPPYPTRVSGSRPKPGEYDEWHCKWSSRPAEPVGKAWWS